jgi:signal transduction histidine kinase
VTPTTIAKTKTTELVDRLVAHRTLSGAPREELEWLATHGELRLYETGDVIASKGQLVTDMTVMLSGRVGVYIERGTGRRHLMESHGGDVTGLLPYSRMTMAIGDVLIEEPTETLAVPRDQLPEMIRECPTVTATLVHVMLDRARQFASTDWQDEKMASLGRLAAGIAHELNNPATAAARSAKLLGEGLKEVGEAAHALGAAYLTESQRSEVATLLGRSLIPPTTGVFSAIERADREDEITGWLERHGADIGPAVALAESGVTVETLDELAEAISGDALDAALRWIAAAYTAQSLTTDIERATTRIYDLVSAVKRFTYMDRATVTEPTDVAQGLVDTVSVLAMKARAKSAAVRLEVAPDLPLVPAYGGELNQIWANLLENALDAVGPSGEVIVNAAREGNAVVVKVIDNGSGIEPDVQSRMFDPFFTTKPLGQGTGLGLDITRRIVRAHAGQIVVDSRPGRTEFRVTLPLGR